jgi:hypothetical protein
MRILFVGSWNLVRQALCGILVGLVLSACDSGSGSGFEAPPQAVDYYPLNVGDRWVYLETSDVRPGTATTTVRVTGTRVVDSGATAFVVQSGEASAPSEDLFVRTATGVQLVPGATADPVTRAVGPYDVLRQPVVAGDSYIPFDRNLPAVADVSGDGRNDDVAIRSEVTVVGFETLTTGLGPFDNVAHVRTLIASKVTLAVSGDVSNFGFASDDWYAQGIGLVRNVSVGGGGSARETIEKQLIAYSVGGRRSESTPPTITSVTPEPNGIARAATLLVVFSEAMDRQVAPASVVSLSGPGGQPVAATAVWQDDRTLALTPSGAVAPGLYIAVVATTALDLPGNALAAPSTWRFTIEAGP